MAAKFYALRLVQLRLLCHRVVALQGERGGWKMLTKSIVFAFALDLSSHHVSHHSHSCHTLRQLPSMASNADRHPIIQHRIKPSTTTRGSPAEENKLGPCSARSSAGPRPLRTNAKLTDLVKIRQRVRISRQLVVNDTELVSRSHHAEALQVDDVQGAPRVSHQTSK